MSSLSSENIAQRISVVEEHIRQENNHNLDGVMSTFGKDPYYEDTPWNQRFEGFEGVKKFYQQFIKALPDFRIEVRNRYVNDTCIILEVEISGTHLGPWRGLPGTGRKVSFPLCALYFFDRENKLKAEKIYYDRINILRQIGMHHDPDSWVGKVSSVLTHPITILKALFLKNP